MGGFLGGCEVGGVFPLGGVEGLKQLEGFDFCCYARACIVQIRFFFFFLIYFYNSI